MKKGSLIFFAVLFMVVVFTCMRAGAVNPCDIYTKADAEAFFKEKVSSQRADKTAAPAGNSCSYFYKKKGGTFSMKLRISSTEEIKKEGIFNSAKDYFERQKNARMNSSSAKKSLKMVPGVGDDAFWSGNSLWIVKGDNLINITVRTELTGSFKNRDAMDKAREEQDLDQSKKLAEKFLSKMK